MKQPISFGFLRFTISSQKSKPMQIVAALGFPGNAEEALKFYQSAIGGEIVRLARYESLPGGELPPEAVGKILHSELVLDGGARLLISDYFECWTGPQVQGSTMSVSLLPTSEAQARDIFAKLSEGGKVVCGIEKSFWNAIYGHFIDKFGVPWQINFDLPVEEGKSAG
jgi:PhnB protein